MIFLFKKKPIVVHCLTTQSELIVRAPIKLAGRCLPEWWKTLPTSLKAKNKLGYGGTMRNCVGFSNLYSKGLILPMWSDLIIEVGSKKEGGYRYQFADLRSSIISHDTRQHGNHFPNNTYQHIKLESPWRFTCSEEIPFLCFEPTWSFIKYSTASILPGVVEFKYQPTTNVNMFVERTDFQQEIFIPLLEPLMHMVPLSERPLRIEISDDLSSLEKLKHKYTPLKFVKDYKHFVRSRKENNR